MGAAQGPMLVLRDGYAPIGLESFFWNDTNMPINKQNGITRVCVLAYVCVQCTNN